MNKKEVNKIKKTDDKRLVIKMTMCLVYLIIITILFVCSYRIFEEKNNIVSWSDVETVEDYTYIKIYKMSEKFAYYQDTNIGIHFVIEKEETGLWHTYLIAINEKTIINIKQLLTIHMKEQLKSQNQLPFMDIPQLQVMN